MSRYDGYKAYETVAEKKFKAKKKLKRLQKKNKNLNPVQIEGSVLSRKWWGKAWLKHLESYADYSNRLPRGKSYVKQGALFHLDVSEGLISALVNGSGRNIYDVKIKVSTLKKSQWKKIVSICKNRIESLEMLCEGEFSKEMEEVLKDPKYGLFPKDSEISFECSCPDWALMCKHVAAVLYGFGTRLDTNPLLFFKLRDVNMEDLLKKSVDEKLDSMLKNAGTITKRTLSNDRVQDLFNIQIDSTKL